jgi:hypothetical protein
MFRIPKNKEIYIHDFQKDFKRIKDGDTTMLVFEHQRSCKPTRRMMGIYSPLNAWKDGKVWYKRVEFFQGVFAATTAMIVVVGLLVLLDWITIVF